jgi:Raf kinase inhibitor-like YbhB/YbcL family protein
MVPVREKSFAPAHPAGVAWAEGRLFVVIWTRGIGTRFDLVELDGELNEVKRIEIKKIQEPSQLAWDGKSLWMTSWYSRTVYKVDINTWQITGSFFSPVSLATGIAWDGKYLWLTGTYGDLYKLELVEKKEIRMAEKIKLTSGAFKEGETIPKRYSGLGENLSPPLSWSDIPAGTKSIALLCDDPDAPRGDWVHWIITNIPADSKGLSEGVPNVKVLADGSVQSVNDSLTTGYDGPCPPSGTHRYFFKVYALDKVLGPKDAVNKKAFLKSIEGHILAEGCLMGRYKR